MLLKEKQHYGEKHLDAEKYINPKAMEMCGPTPMGWLSIQSAETISRRSSFSKKIIHEQPKHRLRWFFIDHMASDVVTEENA